MNASLLGAVVAIGALGCTIPAGPYEPSEPTEPRYERKAIVGYEATGVLATAVGEEAIVGLTGVTGEVYGTSSFTIEEATCSPTCAVTIDGPNRLRVTASEPGVAHVSGRTNGAPAATFEIEIPFRVATKIMVRRAIGSAHSGSAFAMVPGDAQKWIVTLGDDDGPLGADASRFRGEGSEGVFCQPERRAEDREGVYGTPNLQLGCTLQAKQPGTLDVELTLGQLVRTERLRVIPLSSVREASLLVCRQTNHRVETRRASFLIADLLPIEQKDLPCEPVTTILVPPLDCPSRDRSVDLHVVPRLVLDDGTIALGGTHLLAIDGPVSSYNPSGPSSSIYAYDESREVRGKFGTASFVVPILRDECR